MAAHVRLELSGSAENVPVVRQALGGLAEATGLSGTDLNDIRTAVTEACNNTAAHAYLGEAGPLEVELRAEGPTVSVTVRDRGVGMTSCDRVPVGFPIAVDGELAGIGVPSIEALAQTARWSEPDGGGTAVEMTFATAGCASDGAAPHRVPLAPPAIATEQLARTIEVGTAPLAVARTVLPRLLRATATRAHFPVQRHAAVQRALAAVLADGPRAASTDWVQARMVAGPDWLELAIGPFAPERVPALADAVRRAEPQARTTVEALGAAAGQRLVVRLQRTPARGTRAPA